MPLDRGARGKDPAPRPKPKPRPKPRYQSETVARLSLQEARVEAEARRQVRPAAPQPRPVRGEAPADKPAAHTPRVKFQQARNERVAREYGTGRAGGNQQAPGFVSGVLGLGPLAEGAVWAFRNPIDRLQGDVPERFKTYDEYGNEIHADMALPWGPTRGFFRSRRGAARGTETAAETPRGRPRYTRHSLEESGEFFNQTGQRFPAGVAEISRPHDHLDYVNLHDESGDLIASMAFDARPERSRIYVESIYVDPKHRGIEALRELTRPLFGDSRPIDAVFENEKLGRLFERLVERGRRATPEPPPAPESVLGAERVFASLPEARQLRREQEELYRQQRGQRGARAEEAAVEVGGQEGYHAALSQLKGDLPKIKFGALEGQMDQATVDGLFTFVQRHEDLRPYEKLNAQRALQNALEGRVPTRGDIKMLARVFGPDTAAQLADSVPFWAKVKNAGLQIINVPRAIKSSFDLSAPFRQGLVLGARHPRMFSREFRPMLKAFRSEDAYRDIMDDIASRPTFAQMQTGRLALTDLEGLTMREEQFMSNLAEQIPVVGRGVRASGRAYTGFLNKFRADAFDHYVAAAEAQGLEITDDFLKSVGSWVNHATGRGSVKSLEGAMVPLNAMLFSPRLIASRLQLLNPAYYARLEPFARKQALRGITQLGGAVSLTLWLAKLGGAEVGVDPRSADFGKIKIGDTRVDIAGGFQQYLVAGYRFAKGETVSSTSGNVVALEGGFAKPSRADILQRFGEQKLAPVPAFLNAFAKNENFEGDPFDPAKEAGRLFVPLGWEATYDTARDGGPAAAAATFGLGGIGFGVQTYKAKPPKAASKDYKADVAAINAAERRGEIDAATAGQLRNQARASFEAAIRSRDLAGKPEAERDRQLMIDDAVRMEMPLDELNAILAQTGYPPATAEDVTEAELALLELRAFSG